MKLSKIDKKKLKEQSQKIILDIKEIPTGLPQVVSFSGGRTSGLMLSIVLEKYKKEDIIVLFANTGKERNETYEFIHEIETNWNIDVIWLEYTRVKPDENLVKTLKTERMQKYAKKQDKMHWFKVVDFNSAKRHEDENGPFDELLNWMTVLPNPISRSCTAQLKIKTMQRYLWSRGIYSFVNHIGFRYDEVDRIVDIIYSHDRQKEVYYKFLLAEEKITKEKVDEFWSKQSFNLKLQSYEGNCHLCFLKKRKIKQQLVREQPNLTQWWLEQEKKKAESCVGLGARFCKAKGHSIQELINDSEVDEHDNDNDEVYNCLCTAGVTLGSDLEENCEISP